MAAAPARRVLLLALASRLAVLGAMLLADWVFADLDSSARLQGYSCAGSGSSSTPGGGLARKPLLGVWDTVYFVRVARCGYETDKINAFFPGLPAAMRGTGGTVAGLAALVGAPRAAPEAAYVAAGLVLNVAAFCLAALCLHRLSLRVLGGSSKAGSSWGSGMGPTMSHIEGSFRRRSARLRSMGAEPCVSRMPGDVAEVEQQRGHDNSRQLQSIRLRGRSPEEEREQRQGERAADMALIFFCCNPASVFYSAAYSEALFAAATWAGLLLLPRRHWAGVAALAAASALRSNGILGVWFPLHKALTAAATPGGLPLREAGRAALSCAAVLTPYVAMQARGYLAHCGAAAPHPPPTWCTARVPSLYAFIQREYWDVGLLRFYRDPRRLPMVLMSVPVALLSVASLSAYFSAERQRTFTLGLFPRAGGQPPRLLAWAGGVLSTLRASAAAQAGAVWGRQTAAGRSVSQQRAQRRRRLGLGPAFDALVNASPEAGPMVYHWALMTAVALLAMHVNVATRFLSACPPLYWAAGAVAARGGVPARLLWLWCFVYTALGCLLFPNFYPWT